MAKRKPKKLHAKQSAKRPAKTRTIRPERQRNKSAKRGYKTGRTKRGGAPKKSNVLATRKRGVYVNGKRRNQSGTNKKARRVATKTKSKVNKSKRFSKRRPARIVSKVSRQTKEIKRLKAQLKKAKKTVKKLKAKKARPRIPESQRPPKLKRLPKVTHSLKSYAEIKHTPGVLSDTRVSIDVSKGFDFIRNGSFEWLKPLIEKNKQPDGSFKYPQGIVVGIESGEFKNDKGESTTFLRAKNSPFDMEVNIENVRRFILERIELYESEYQQRKEDDEDGEGLTVSGEASDPDNAEFIHIKFIY